jgi:hypothetical protein
VMSWASAGSVLSSRARATIMGDPERTHAALLAECILLSCACAIAGWAIFRR